MLTVRLACWHAKGLDLQDVDEGLCMHICRSQVNMSALQRSRIIVLVRLNGWLF